MSYYRNRSSYRFINSYLEHAQKTQSKYPGGFTKVNGRTNNTPEYNHAYYLANKFKWVTEYAKNAAAKAVNAAKGVATQAGQYANQAGKQLNEWGNQAGQTLNKFGTQARAGIARATNPIGQATYNLNYKDDVARGKSAAGMPSYVRQQHTQTSKAVKQVKKKVKSAEDVVKSYASAKISSISASAGAAYNKAKDTAKKYYGAALSTLSSLSKKAKSAATQARASIARATNPIGKAVYDFNYKSDVARGTAKGSGGMPSNVRQQSTRTGQLVSNVKSTLNSGRKSIDDLRTAASEKANQIYRDTRAGVSRAMNPIDQARYNFNNQSDISRGKSAAGMPSYVREQHTRTGELKRNVSSGINSAREGATQLSTNMRNKISEVKTQVAAGKPLSKIKDYYNVVSQLTDLGYMQGEIERMLGVKFTRGNQK